MPTRRATLQSLLEQLSHGTVGAARECQQLYEQAERSSNERKYDVIAFTVALVRRLKESEREHKQFFSQDFWEKKPKEVSEPKAIRMATRFVLGCKTAKGSLYEQARTYAKVVRHFEENGTEPLDVIKVLNQQSIHGLVDKINESQYEGSSKPANSSAFVESSTVRSELDRELENPPTAYPPKSRAGDREMIGADLTEQTNAVKPRAIRFDRNRDIAIDAAGFFNRILNCPIGGMMVLRVKRRPDEGNWHQYRIESFKEKTVARAANKS